MNQLEIKKVIEHKEIENMGMLDWRYLVALFLVLTTFTFGVGLYIGIAYL